MQQCVCARTHERNTCDFEGPLDRPVLIHDSEGVRARESERVAGHKKAHNQGSSWNGS